MAERDAELSIRKALHSWLDAYRREDYREMHRVWAPDLLGWFPNQEPYTYEKALRGAERVPTHDPTRAEIDLDIEEILVRGDLAVVRDIWHYTRRFGTDSTLTRRLLGYEVWRLQPDGKWRISRYLSAPEPWQRTP